MIFMLKFTKHCCKVAPTNVIQPTSKENIKYRYVDLKDSPKKFW